MTPSEAMYHAEKLVYEDGYEEEDGQPTSVNAFGVEIPVCPPPHEASAHICRALLLAKMEAK